MRPVLVVVAAVGAEHVLEVAAAEDEDPVDAVGANGADPTLDEGVRVRGLNWRADDLDALAAEDLVEGVADFVSGSWMRNRNGCSSPNCMTRLAISCRSQASSVSGWKEKTVQAGRGIEPLSDAGSARSARVNVGREDFRWRIASSWRGRGSPTPSNDAAAPAATPARTGSGQRDTQTTRARSLPRP